MRSLGHTRPTTTAVPISATVITCTALRTIEGPPKAKAKAEPQQMQLLEAKMVHGAWAWQGTGGLSLYFFVEGL